MSKRDVYFRKISVFKERFQKLPSEILKARLTSYPLVKEAAIALREVLNERAEGDELPPLFNEDRIT